jgi:SNF2 family DNA or RNA helicase
LEDFPENTVLAEAFDLPETEAAEEAEEAFEELENSEEGASDENPLTVSLRARQASELAKMPIFADLTAESLEEGNHVVCFLNFTESLEALGDQLRKKKIEYAVIAGNDKDRDGVIKNFQENKTPVLLVMIQAGGVGISLHDLHGTPRTSLISPPYSTVELKQALGRIHRAGAKSKAVQRIIFAAGTIEESVCRKLKSKLRNLDALLDGPILSTSDFEIKTKRKRKNDK